VAERLLRSYRNLLLSALANLDAPIGWLDILTDSETQQLDAWNQTGSLHPWRRVDRLFEDRVADRPEHPAVTFEGRSMTYAELSEGSTRLAARLSAMGVGPGALAAICMDRSIEMIVALLAVVKTGAAFLPLDPAFPPARIAFMDKDARPLAMLTQSHLRERFSFSAPHVLALDIEGEEAGRSPEFVPEVSPRKQSSANDLAYVIYTSGSTATPKGVEITHAALTNLLIGATSILRLKPG
jgi:non-ribosomal peptide synthetase component F